MNFGLTHLLNNVWTNAILNKNNFGLTHFGLKNFELPLIRPTLFRTNHPDPTSQSVVYDSKN